MSRVRGKGKLQNRYTNKTMKQQKTLYKQGVEGWKLWVWKRGFDQVDQTGGLPSLDKPSIDGVNSKVFERDRFGRL